MMNEARVRLAESLLQNFHENSKLHPTTLPFAAPEWRGGDREVVVPTDAAAMIQLPPVGQLSLGMSVREAIVRRRSIRSYRPEPMSLAQLGRFLFFGSSPELFLDDPGPEMASMLSLCLFLWGAEELSEATYRYDRQRHVLVHLADGPRRSEIGASIFQQEFSTGTGILLLIGDIGTAVETFGLRGYRYLMMQAGLVGEACYLAGTALGVGVSGNGGMREATVQRYCRLDGIRRDLLWTLPFGLPDTRPAV